MEQKLKCLHCGFEYTVRQEPKAAPRERVCPKCQSNSVRKLASK
jgi:predicted Zn-ribbon and HTH transcriptional regulator